MSMQPNYHDLVLDARIAAAGEGSLMENQQLIRP
jgi:hypothetical protein